MDTSTLHVVLGAGQIGAIVRDRLLESGVTVRQIRRGPAGSPRPGLEWRSGDMQDLDFAESAISGASVVYDCMTPAYHKWPLELLPLARGALHGAAKAGARLVALDNLYAYGRPTVPMRPESPELPSSKKGALRKQLAEERLAAHRSGKLEVAVARASDFFGPAITDAAIFGERFFERALRGRAVECFGDPDALHSYTFGPDVARALIAIGKDPGAFGRVWHVPTNPAETTRQGIERFAQALGRPLRIAKVPDLALRVLGLVNPLIREVVEMTYQWKLAYVIDDSAFRTRFGFGPTAWDSAIAETLKWARRSYAAPKIRG